MPRSHPKSARPDQARSHRSQAKPAKAQPILLDRLDAALCRHNIVLKRSALQTVAAEAFGFHNANEFAGADLVPPAAQVLGRAEIDDGRSLIVVQDPSVLAIYGLDEAFFRETIATSRRDQYGISPYGDLVDLSGILNDRRSGLPVAPTESALSYTPDPVHLYAGETVHFVRIEIDPAHPVLFVDLTRKALDETVSRWCRENWAQGANPEIDPATLKNANAVLLAYFAGDLRSCLIYEQTKLPSPPKELGRVTLPVWTAYHGDAEGHRVYVDATEIGLHTQIRELLASIWEEIEDDADAFDDQADIAELIALYHRHSAMRITLGQASITLPAGSPTVGTARSGQGPIQAASRRWQDAVARGETTLGEDQWLQAIARQAGATAPTIDQDDAGIATPPTEGDAGVDLAEDPVFLRSDWTAACRRDPRTPAYSAWVQARKDNDASRHWLRAPCRKTLVSGDRRCVVDLHGIAQKRRLDGLAVGTTRYAPGDVVTVQDAIFYGDSGYAHLVTADDGHFMVESQHRAGLMPILKFADDAIPEDVTRHYPRRDWEVEMEITGRDLSYATWVASQYAQNRIKTEDWMTLDRLQRMPPSVPLRTCLFHTAIIQGPAGQRQTLCRPGQQVHLLDIDDLVEGVLVTLMTADEGTFTLRISDRGGYIPVTTQKDGVTYPFAKWLSQVEAEIGPVDASGYEAYYKSGMTPSRAIAQAKAMIGADAPDCLVAPNENHPADAFLWAVAEELGRNDLTHDAAFQEFCANMHGTVTVPQAAESWERR